MAPKASLKRKANTQAAPKAKKVQLGQPKSSLKPEKKRSQPVTALAPPAASGTESEDEEEIVEDGMGEDDGEWEDDDGQDDAMDQDEPNESNKPPKDPNGMFGLFNYVNNSSKSS